MSSLLDALNEFTVPGDLYTVVDADAHKIRCLACAHRCLLKDGRRGICQVRYNAGGVLRVPHGYVSALQLDPTEKKPFFHLLPGSLALSFGMLGCDLRCSYCFTGDTVVMTDRGPIRLDALFEESLERDYRPDGDIAYPQELHALAASGAWRKVRAVFRHRYQGPLVIIRPYHLLEMRCTPDHRIYATTDPARLPEPIEAQYLTSGHYLAVPRCHAFSASQEIDVVAAIGSHNVSYQQVSWDLPLETRQHIVAASAHGETSRQIGATLGIDASYIRHVRSKIARGRGGDTQTGKPVIEAGWLRFPHERHPGIPISVPLDEGLARLFGFYCAEGSVVTLKDRPNSHSINFAFAPGETAYADEVQSLLRTYFGVEASQVRRETSLGVHVSKASLALLFKTLAGEGAAAKRVPPQFFNAPRNVVAAFLDAFVAGNGHRYSNGKVSITTVSPTLAYGVAWLALKQGYMPSMYNNAVGEWGTILGRVVKQVPRQYTVVWYERAIARRRLVETESHYLVPLREVVVEGYAGDVYNMEVEVEHNYLAGFLLVKNCQNWDISQFGRDDAAGRDPLIISADRLVQLARQRRADVVASTYNEPLITTEWAVDVFRRAKTAGMRTAYVSNGNATPEVLDYLRPHLDAYKIDLKSMRDASYRRLGAVLQHVLDTITRAHQMGLWVEVVTLIVPGFNDSTEELWDAARFLAGVSPDIPWHVTAFHPDYQMTDPPPTSVQTLRRAAEIGLEAGLRYVYAGNIPGAVGNWEDTRCPTCGTTLVRRRGFTVQENRLAKTGGACPTCGTVIAGRWV